MKWNTVSRKIIKYKNCPVRCDGPYSVHALDASVLDVLGAKLCIVLVLVVSVLDVLE